MERGVDTMSKQLDERVVALQFDNSNFEKNSQTTLNTLDSLKKALRLDGAAQGLTNIEKAGKSFDLSGITSQVDAVQSKFSALQVIGYSALQNLTNTAIDKGKSIGRALVDPIIEGGKKRALNIEQAKFQFKGLGMDVEEAMKNAGDAVDGTAYGLS